MWTMISNSLDIDFIHSDIHGRSCKNAKYLDGSIHVLLPVAPFTTMD